MFQCTGNGTQPLGMSRPAFPLDALTEYIARAQLAVIGWWMEQRTPYYRAANRRDAAPAAAGSHTRGF
jgi:hypothetical protein